MHVAELAVYPVKSLRGVRPASALVEPHGLRHDRRWMVVDEAGDKLRLEHHPHMLSVTAHPAADGGIELTTPGRAALRVPPPLDGAPTPVSLARVGWAREAAPDVHAWISAVLGRSARLVWLDDPGRRPVSASHGGRAGEVLSLADTGPLLLTSTASLRRLETWAQQRYAERYASCPRDAGSRPSALSMERFRPNLVVDGDLEAFVEDTWTTVDVGEVRFRVSELCDRCPVPGIDPSTQTLTAEPLRTLAKHRRRDGKTWFGIRLVPLTTGTVAVGDVVTASGPTPAAAGG